MQDARCEFHQAGKREVSVHQDRLINGAKPKDAPMNIRPRKSKSTNRPRGAYRKVSTKERFDGKFRITPGCWIWTGGFLSTGYGSFAIDRREVKAHRAAYLLYVGDIPDGMLVCHRCDNPQCVNPDHLFLGSHKDNMLDMISKGRAAFQKAGHAPQKQPKKRLEKLCDRHTNRIGNFKLLEVQVLQIFHDERPNRTIAEDFGISQANVNRIKHKQTWKKLLEFESSKGAQQLASPPLT